MKSVFKLLMALSALSVFVGAGLAQAKDVAAETVSSQTTKSQRGAEANSSAGSGNNASQTQQVPVQQPLPPIEERKDTQDVLNRPGKSVFFVNLLLDKSKSSEELRKDFAEFCEDQDEILNSLRLRFKDDNLQFSFGISRHAWNILFPNTTPPKQLRTFKEIKGPDYTAPSTPGDIFLHIRSNKADVDYELLRQLMTSLGEFTKPEYEIHGFSYEDGRSIIGFVDGTANPVGTEARNAVLIGDEDPAYKYGSYMFTQKYLHDMKTWEALSVEEQEKIIGRHKFDDRELDDDQKYRNAHNVISLSHDANGDEIDILRANVMFSKPSQNEYGTFFISYSRTFDVVQDMLNHMFLGQNGSTHDKLLEFSTAKTGTLFFVPSKELIGKMGKQELK